MKKGLLVGLLAFGFVFAGVLSASAGSITWTMIQTAGMSSHSPGGDNLVGTADDGSDRCNFSNATACASTGAPTTGAYSFSKLNFVQASSCVLAGTGAQEGDLCTDNASCAPGGGLGVCVDCNSAASGLAYSFFGKDPAAGTKGNGTMKVDACDDGFTYTSVGLGSSEVVIGSGGGCLTLTTGSGTSTNGCGTGSIGSTMSLDLWTNTVGNCGFPAGSMPGIATSGQVIDVGAGPSGDVCGYSVAEINGIIADANLSASNYLMIVCGQGTLPSDLQSACLPGAHWLAVLIAKATVDVDGICPEACSSSGCMAGTAEAVE